MDVLAKLDKITECKNSGGSWYELAGMVEEISRSESWRSRADWVKEAAKSSGYHPAVIRRMIRARGFLDRITGEQGIIIDKSRDIPLASIEILERMYPLAASEVIGLVDKALNGKVTLREVQKIYDQIIKQQPDKADRIGSVRRQANDFRQLATMWIMGNINLLSCGARISLINKAKVPFPLEVDIIVISSYVDGSRHCDGFDILFVADSSQKNRGNILQRIAFSCEFFRRFWVVLPEHQCAELGVYLFNKLRELELYNVSFCLLKDQSKTGVSDVLSAKTSSVYQPDICSPREAGFFVPESNYIPHWKHLLLKYINSELLISGISR